MTSLQNVENVINSVDANLPPSCSSGGAYSSITVDKIIRQPVTSETKTPTHINDLPNEVLSAIFEIGVDLGRRARMGTFVDDMYPTSKDDESNISESWECPTVVSHVCSRWRNCALATPNLWTRILWEEEMSFDKATTWIARSKAALLEIDLLFSKENATTDGVSEQITEALSILLPHLHRWYGIDIQFETYASLFQVLKALEGKEAPELRHLMLSYDGKEDYNEALFPPISFLNGPGSAPRLQSVTLWETPVSLSDFPWNSTLMSQLDIDYSPEEFMSLGSHLPQMLSSFTNLLRLHLGNSGLTWDLPESVPEDSILLPILHSISFHSFESSRPLEQLIRCLKMPTLKRLSLERLYGNDSPNTTDFAPTLAVLSRRIEGLTLEKVALLNVYISSGEALLNLLTHCRTIKHIHFDLRCIYPYHDPYFNVLGPLRTGPVMNFEQYCPNLETAAFSGFYHMILLNVAFSFRAAGKPLKKIWYYGEDGMDEEPLNALKEAVGEVLEMEESDEESGSGDDDSEGDREDDWEDEQPGFTIVLGLEGL